MRIFITIAICCLGISAFGQTLTLKKDHKTKVFNENDFVTLHSEPNYDEDCNNCDTRIYRGRLIDIKSDSVSLKMESYQRYVNRNGKNVIDATIYKGANELTDIMTVSKRDIYRIDHYKSDKKANGRNLRAGVGGILIATGIITLVDAIIVKDKSDKQTLTQVGLIGLGIGIPLAASSAQKKYNTFNQWYILE